MALRRQTMNPTTVRPTSATTSSSSGNKRMSMGAPKMMTTSQSVKKIPSNKGSGSSNTGNGSSTSRSSVGPRASSLAPRQSLAGGSSNGSNSGSRQSSVGGRGAPPFDPKEVQRGIIEYLAEHRFPHPLSPKILSSPSARDVAAMYSFVFSKFDASLAEGDIATTLVILKCPIMPTKSHLSVPGAPGASISVLNALYWVICIIKYRDATTIADHPIWHASRAYRSWIQATSDDEAEQVKSSYAADIVARYATEQRRITDDLAAQLNAKSIINNQIEQFRSGNDVLAANNKRVQLLQDISDASTRLQLMVSYRDDRLAVADRKVKAERSVVNAQLAQAMSDIAALKLTISQQKCTAQQAADYQHTHSDRRTKLDAQIKLRAATRERLYASETAITQLTIDLDAKTATYNDAIPNAMIPSIPVGAITSSSSNNSGSGHTLDDVRIDQHMETEKRAMITNVAAIQRDTIEAAKEATHLVQLVAEKNKHAAMAHERVTNMRSLLQQETSRFNNELKALESKVDITDTETRSIEADNMALARRREHLEDEFKHAESAHVLDINMANARITALNRDATGFMVTVKSIQHEIAASLVATHEKTQALAAACDQPILTTTMA